MTVLVAIPYWRAAPWIGGAVRAALAQEGDVAVLVAGDGEAPPLDVRDDRLVVLSWPDNLGAPLTQQAMLAGSPFRWYAPHGADDWAEPGYTASLLALGGLANGSRSFWHELPDGTSARVSGDTAHVEFGVFDAELLRSLGGYGADRRCGQDTLLYEQLLPAVERVRWMDEPRYHKRLHPGSLTSDPATGFGSAYRAEVVSHNAEVALACARIGLGDLAAVRRYRESIIPAPLRAALEARVEDVRRALS